LNRTIDRSKHINPDIASGNAMIVPGWATHTDGFPTEPMAKAWMRKEIPAESG